MMRLRTLMILVALVALSFGRVGYFRQRATQHEREVARTALTDLELYLTVYGAPAPGAKWQPSPEDPPWVGMIGPVAEFYTYHRDLWRKYEEAADRPWTWVEADPPPPPRLSDEFLARYCKSLNDP